MTDAVLRLAGTHSLTANASIPHRRIVKRVHLQDVRFVSGVSMNCEYAKLYLASASGPPSNLIIAYDPQGNCMMSSTIPRRLRLQALGNGKSPSVERNVLS